MAEKRNIPFRIKGIETVQFPTMEDSYKEGCDISFLVGVPISASDEDHSIEVTLNIQFKCEEVPFIILEIKVQFDIEPEAFQSLFITKKKKTPTILEELGITQERILRELARVAFSDKKECLQEDYELKDLKNIGSETTSAIKTPYIRKKSFR
jgi:hypothetical protein